MTVSQLAQTLDLKRFSPGNGEREVRGGYVGDLLSWVMSRAKAEDAWITIMSNVNVASVAELTDVSCVILAEGVEPDPGLSEKLGRIRAGVYGSPLGAYELAWRVNAALRA